ncbi:MAG TPA: hypothetical protein VFQ53_19110 [Kofleriaceae bacterium]|nr:hypothetical protein [Kofleriaceae bacterium]
MIRGLLLVFVVAACDRATRGAIYCRDASAVTEDHGVNPLLAGVQSCFDLREACERGAVAGACAAVDPAWHCATVRSAPTDPLHGTTTCFPSRATCAARNAGACVAAEAVYCDRAEGGLLMCSATEHDCKRASAFVDDVVVGHERTAGCTRYVTAR